MKDTLFEVIDRLRRIDLEARTRGYISGEDAIWMADYIRKVEAEKGYLDSDLDSLRKKLRRFEARQYEWDSKFWALTDSYRDTIDRLEEELVSLNKAVQDVLHTSAAPQGLAELSEISEKVRARQENLQALSEVLVEEDKSYCLGRTYEAPYIFKWEEEDPTNPNPPPDKDLPIKKKSTL